MMVLNTASTNPLAAACHAKYHASLCWFLVKNGPIGLVATRAAQADVIDCFVCCGCVTTSEQDFHESHRQHGTLRFLATTFSALLLMHDFTQGPEMPCSKLELEKALVWLIALSKSWSVCQHVPCRIGRQTATVGNQQHAFRDTIRAYTPPGSKFTSNDVPQHNYITPGVPGSLIVMRALKSVSTAANEPVPAAILTMGLSGGRAKPGIGGVVFVG